MQNRSSAICTKLHEDRFCSLISSRSSQAEATVDLNNPSQSGWIWASVVFYTPLGILGILGNILTIIMFVKYIKRTTTTTFITTLAVVDLTVCSTSLPMSLYSLVHGSQVTNAFCKTEKFLAFLAIPLSGCILLAIAIDRFLLIFFLNKVILTQFRARIIVICIFIVCFLAAVPQPLSFSTIIHANGLKMGCQGEFTCDIQICQLSRIIPEHVRNKLWEGLIGFYLSTIVLFVILYTLIFRKVYKMHKKMLVYKHRPVSRLDSMRERDAVASSETIAQDPTRQHSANGTLMPPNPEKSMQPSAKEARLKLSSTDNSESDDGLAEGVTLTKTMLPPSYNVATAQVCSKIKKRKRLPHLQTAITLFMVTISFVIAYAPMFLISQLQSCGSSGRIGASQFSCKRNNYQHFLWRFIFLSHIANPIIYALLNPLFRDAVRKWYNQCCCSLLARCDSSDS